MKIEFKPGDRVYKAINNQGHGNPCSSIVYGTVVERPPLKKPSRRVHKGVYVRFGDGPTAVYQHVPMEKLTKVNA